MPALRNAAIHGWWPLTDRSNPDWRAAVQEAGATMRAYLPDHALLVEAPLAARSAMRQLPHVAGLDEYRPVLKVQPLLAALSRQQPDLPVPITLQTFSPADVAALERALETTGASDIRAAAGKRWGLLRAVLPARAAVEFAQWPEVQWVEHHEPPRLLNDAARAADRLNADTVRDDFGLDGARARSSPLPTRASTRATPTPCTPISPIASSMSSTSDASPTGATPITTARMSPPRCSAPATRRTDNTGAWPPAPALCSSPS
jgi:hypothetical protein